MAQEAKEEMVAIARLMLDGKLDLFEGVRQLSDLSHRLPSDQEPQQVVRTLSGIDSEIDDLPLGRVRSGWAEEALAEKDREREAYQERSRTKIEEACRLIIEGWSDGLQGGEGR
jgi:hypothetical protein